MPAVRNSGVTPAARNSANALPAHPQRNSSQKIPVPQSQPLPGASSGSSGRMRSLGSEQIAANRRALGLSEVKLSDQIAGLDKAGERAEKLAQREEAKRKAGGKADVNRAVLTDGTGSRWKRMVLMGLGGTAALVLLVGGVMMWLSNRTAADPREQQRTTHERLMRYEKLYTPRMQAFEPDETVTAETFKERLLKFVQQELDNEKGIAEREKALRKVVSLAVKDNLQRLEGDVTFLDGAGQAFVFEGSSEDRITIKNTGKPEDFVTVQVPRVKPKETRKIGPK